MRMRTPPFGIYHAETRQLHYTQYFFHYISTRRNALACYVVVAKSASRAAADSGANFHIARKGSSHRSSSGKRDTNLTNLLDALPSYPFAFDLHCGKKLWALGTESSPSTSELERATAFAVYISRA